MMANYVDALIDTELGRANDGIALALNQVIMDAVSVGAEVACTSNIKRPSANI